LVGDYDETPAEGQAERFKSKYLKKVNNGNTIKVVSERGAEGMKREAAKATALKSY